MRRIGVTTLFVASFCLTGMSQSTSWDKTVFVKAAPNSATTVTIYLYNHNQNEIGRLKDDLIQFEEKVESVLIKDRVSEMYITYNDHMLLEDLIKVFRENGFEYLLEPKDVKIKEKSEQL